MDRKGEDKLTVNSVQLLPGAKGKPWSRPTEGGSSTPSPLGALLTVLATRLWKEGKASHLTAHWL